MRTLEQLLMDRKLFKNIPLFFDIETFQYNEREGKSRPSAYKNMTFSVAISWIEAGHVEFEVFPSFKEPLNIISEVFAPMKKKPTILLNAHNTNKYDNHFLRKDLLYFYPQMKVKNYWLMTATTEKSNENAIRLKDLSVSDKKGIILEKRVKSSINLELIFYLNGIQFRTVDSWVKTNASLAMLGKKLKRLGKVTDDELKTDFNYTKYNQPQDLTEEEARAFALDIFNQLSLDELTYIQNDVILLAKSVYYYSDLFNGFDYSKMTFTSNILEAYNTNDLTSFQLLNRIGQGKEQKKIQYTDYHFAGKNFYDYLKPFYRGGLNFYNQYFIGQHITSGVFGMDINSSYPYAMHNFKIPTYLKEWKSFEKPTPISVITDNQDVYTLFQLSKETFDLLILDRIESVIIKQMLVKYYNHEEAIHLNTYTFKMLEEMIGLHFDTIPVMSYLTFETEYFGSREQIEAFYQIKTQGDNENKIIFKSPYDITITDDYNEQKLSKEEYDSSKVQLNGLYGIPALRPYFNLFRLDESKNKYINIENGHQNAERNIVFSIFVTSVALWNLLTPFKYLTQDEIDENFLYADTDSLYFKKAIQHKIPDFIFSANALGKWGLDYDHLTDFYVLNHKKYCLKEPSGDIKVRAGGIPNRSFNTNMSFEEFIETQFSHGVELQTTKSIYNDQQTISIYPSITKLEQGGGYRLFSSSALYTALKEHIFEEARASLDEFTSDILYLETIIGTFSLADLFPVVHEVKNKRKLIFLQMIQEQLKNIITQ